MKLTAYIMIFYFTLGACIPKCDFSQLLKINDLMEHYELHQKEAIALGKTVNFSEFLLLHFFNAEQHEHDSENSHDNLPLQNFTTSIVLCITTPQLFPTSFNQIIERSLPNFHSHYIKTITFDIFHPPKIA